MDVPQAPKVRTGKKVAVVGSGLPPCLAQIS
jgi:NADPH-dependent glutamate synthase beta subunit-like oxidoreductase